MESIKIKRRTTIFTGIIGGICNIYSAIAVIQSPYDPLPVMGSGLGMIMSVFGQTIFFIFGTLIIQTLLYIHFKKSVTYLLIISIYILGITINYITLLNEAKKKYYSWQE
jgi:hypothetical protein